jgi:hypothetical protein
MDAPANPTIGQTWYDGIGNLKVWTGSIWTDSTQWVPNGPGNTLVAN